MDEHKTLEWVDVFADYMITFIGNPDAFKSFMLKQRAEQGVSGLNVKVVNEEAERKNQLMKNGSFITPEVDNEMKDAWERVTKKIAIKKKEEFKDIL